MSEEMVEPKRFFHGLPFVGSEVARLHLHIFILSFLCARDNGKQQSFIQHKQAKTALAFKVNQVLELATGVFEEQSWL
jgi:hypothetical protein